MRTSTRYRVRCASPLIVLLVLAFGSMPALSQDEAASETVSLVKRKSEAAALRWSLLGTALPVSVGAALAASGPTADDVVMPIAVLITAGALVGPSLGHFYADRPKRGVNSAGLRTGVVVTSLWLSLKACPFSDEDCSSSQKSKAAAFLLAGVGLITASAIYDILTAPASVRKSNRAVGSLNLSPYVSPDSRAVGFLAYVRF